MTDITCKHCNHEFTYDESVGLNVALKKGTKPGSVRILPGVFPCCPKCEGLTEPPKAMTAEGEDRYETTINWTISYVPLVFPVALPQIYEQLMVDMVADQLIAEEAGSRNKRLYGLGKNPIPPKW